MSDYRIKISISNGRILRLMDDAGIETQTELARRAGMGVVAVNAIVKMRDLPKLQNGDWRDAVQRIAAVLGVAPEEMFTDTQANGTLEKSTFETGLTEAQMGSLCGPDAVTQLEEQDMVAHLMMELPDRERRVITARMEGDTLAEVGLKIGTQAERVRQLEARAIRHMRRQAHRLNIRADDAF